MRRRLPDLLFALFAVSAVALPFVAEGYELYRFTLAAAYAIGIIGINLLTGATGQFSIGHSAFFALGAFATALTGSELGLSLYHGLGVAVGVGFIAGFLFGWPALRLDNVLLALATWALAMVVPQVLRSSHLETWTGGVQGVYLDQPAPPAWFPGSIDQWWYGIAVSLMLLVFLLVRNLLAGRIGRAWRGLRDNPLAAEAMGVNLSIYKTIAFAISAATAALAGGLVAILNEFVAPDSYTVFFGILLLLGAVAGGINSIWGALFGGFMVEFLPDIASNASAAVSFPLFGFLLIGLIWLMPNGLADRVNRLARRP